MAPYGHIPIKHVIFQSLLMYSAVILGQAFHHDQQALYFSPFVHFPIALASHCRVQFSEPQDEIPRMEWFGFPWFPFARDRPEEQPDV